MSFYDVFEGIKSDDEIREMFADTEVTRVASNKDGTSVKVYLQSTHLIPKHYIYQMEYDIKKQIFSGTDVSVNIFEDYKLSSAYNVKSLLGEYLPSIHEEIKKYDPFISSALTKAELSYPDNKSVVISIPESFTAKVKHDEIIRIFEKVICERCHLDADVSIEYIEPEEDNFAQLAEEKFNQAVSRVSKSYFGSKEAIEETGEVIDVSNIDVNEGSEWDSPVAAGSSKPDTVAKTVEKTSVVDNSAGTTPNNNVEKTKADSAVTAAKTPLNTKKEKPAYTGRSDGNSSGRRKFGQGRYVSDNPDVIYGADFEDPFMRISDIDGTTGEAVIRGQIVTFEDRETRKGSHLFIFTITDFTDTISVKMFPKEFAMDKARDGLKPGSFILVKGVASLDRFDNELSIGYVIGIKKTDKFTKKREDTESVKRVELHCHTKMSDMDAVSDVSDIIKRAAGWGHKALAITDHGVVQAFTDAFHTMQKIGKDYPDFKLIYGVEGYLVDDIQICDNPKDYNIDDTYVVFDIETTGFSPVDDKIIEIGAVKVVDGKIVDRFSEFINPQIPIPYRIVKLTGITDEMVKDARLVSEVLPDFLKFCDGVPFVGHNVSFDVSFIKQKSEELGYTTDFTSVDTVGLAKLLLPQMHRFKLDNVAKELKIPLKNHHRAVEDAEATAEIFVKFVEMLKERDAISLKEINKLGDDCVDMIKKSHAYHVIILAKNETGRINLYRLVSESHLNYFYRTQRIPKRLLNKYREGLIIGSACEAGELFSAIVEKKSDAEIARIVQFYDYLEIQPIGNNAFMIRDDRYEDVNTEEDLIRFNKKIVELGMKFNKKVCATCDVHFLDPEDEIYRRIIMSGKFSDADYQAPLYLRTTEEMLREFDYLGYEKAYEVVVTNPNLIADMVDVIEPVRPDKCPPVIDKSDEMLRSICERRAHEIYGETLPTIVSERLKRELDSIISNGFAVMYIIAQKLVWKSVEDGYLVGSRGSVGSSFVATMAGITEVNPLSPHYLCPKCHYVDFDSDEVKQYAGKAGCDMPDKVCPECGTPLMKEGFDIPFETFLGFEGNKEPDIDLNFSGEYQQKAHKYTEVIFGSGQTFKAGTIGTLADKTAYGYVKKYYEEHGQTKRGCEINRRTLGCTGIHRTTGQHPGGIIVLPLGEEIYSFTPIQHPANDMTTDIVTTHFDYHSIDHNLLKLDILGHDDPSMIRMLQDLTDTDPTEVPLDDKKVMSLFQNTEALGVTPEDLGGCKMGSLGIPEFGTDFAMQMLIDTNPQAFSDLVRIAGLSHGTDVWIGNAKDLIEQGKATISTAICTRDDIMTYLIGMGLEPGIAFKIMENVRKGNVAKKKCDKWPEWRELMLNHDVPDWYVESCEKIKYMFPKAHAAAYVMMAWRVAYYKVYYPLAYYAAFFSIRASSFDYEKMCQGRAHLEYVLKEYREKPAESLTNKEQDEIKDMRLVQEMYARGYDFMPIDIFKAQAHRCQIIDGKIMPHIGSIAGLGDKAADAVVEACKDGPFLSRDDFRERTKVPAKVIETMSELGLLGNIPKSNQLSLFDMMG